MLCNKLEARDWYGNKLEYFQAARNFETIQKKKKIPPFFPVQGEVLRKEDIRSTQGFFIHFQIYFERYCVDCAF